MAPRTSTASSGAGAAPRLRPAAAPPARARSAWWIPGGWAGRTLRRPGSAVGGFAARPPAETFDEVARLWPSVAGMSYARLESGGLQWPCPTPDHPGTRYLYAHSFPRGKGRFVPVAQRVQAAALPDPESPFRLNTRRLLYQSHRATTTGPTA